MATYTCTADASCIQYVNGTDVTSDWNATGYMTPVGCDSTPTYKFRGVLQFNGLNTALPTMTSVSSATLKLYYYNQSGMNALSAGTSTTRTLQVYFAPSGIVDSGGNANFPSNGWTSNGNYNFENKCVYTDTTNTASVSIAGTKTDGTLISVNVTSMVQYALANQATFTFRGFILRLSNESSASSAAQFYSLQGGNSAYYPVLEVTAAANTAPNAPTGLSPTGGAKSTATSYIGDLSDPDANDTLSAAQVLVSTTSAFTTTLWDSGEVAQSGTSFSISNGASLSYGTTYYWKARTKDAGGLWGPYSSGTDSFQKNTKPNTPSGLLPTGNAIVETLTPTFSGTASDPDTGDYIAQARVVVKRVSDNVTMWDSGYFSCGVASFTVVYGSTGTPTNLSLNTAYYWYAYVKDSNGAASSASSSSYFTTYASGVSNMTPSTNGGTGWVKTLTPSFNFVTPVNMNQYTLKFYDANSNLLYTVGPTTVSPAATTLATPYTLSGLTLAWGTKYQWTATFRDTSNVTQTESSKAVFWTNAAPIGNNIYPANNQAVTSIDPAIQVGFSDQDLSNGFADAPTKLEVEVSRVSDSLVMYTTTKASGLASNTNALAQSTSGATKVATATVTGVTAAGGIITYTCLGGHPFSAGQVVSMTGINPTAYNLTNQTILGSPNQPTSQTFKIQNAATGTFVSGGTATSTGTTTLAYETQYRYRSRYTDSSGIPTGVGNWSSYVFFKPTVAPVIAYTNNGSGVGQYTNGVLNDDLSFAKINNSMPDLSYSFTSSGGKAQKSRRVRVLDANSNVVYDTGYVLTTSTLVTIPDGYVLNAATYTFEITAVDTDDVTSNVITTTYAALWSVPADITGVNVIQGNGSLGVIWDISAEANFLYYSIYRETYGSGEEYQLLATISNKATTKYMDYSAGVGVKYEYKVTQTTQPPSSHPVQSSIDTASQVVDASESDNWWLVVDGNDALGTELYVDNEGRTEPYQEETFEPFGRSRKVIVRYAQYGVEGSLSAYIPNDEVATKMPNLRAIFALTVPVYVKSPFGDVYKAYLGTPSYEYSTAGTTKVSFNYVEVD